MINSSYFYSSLQIIAKSINTTLQTTGIFFCITSDVFNGSHNRLWPQSQHHNWSSAYLHISMCTKRIMLLPQNYILWRCLSSACELKWGFNFHVNKWQNQQGYIFTKQSVMMGLHAVTGLISWSFQPNLKGICKGLFQISVNLFFPYPYFVAYKRERRVS